MIKTRYKLHNTIIRALFVALLLVIMLFQGNNLRAQNNADMNDWTFVGGVLEPDLWFTLNGLNKSEPPCARVIIQSDTCAQLTSAKFSGMKLPSSLAQQTLYNQKIPNKISIKYKYTGLNQDSAAISVSFIKSDTTVTFIRYLPNRSVISTHEIDIQNDFNTTPFDSVFIYISTSVNNTADTLTLSNIAFDFTTNVKRFPMDANDLNYKINLSSKGLSVTNASPNAKKVMVYSTSGQLVKKTQINDQILIQGLHPSTIYVIKIIDSQNFTIFTKKLTYGNY